MQQKGVGGGNLHEAAYVANIEEVIYHLDSGFDINEKASQYHFEDSIILCS